MEWLTNTLLPAFPNFEIFTEDELEGVFIVIAIIDGILIYSVYTIFNRINLILFSTVLFYYVYILVVQS